MEKSKEGREGRKGGRKRKNEIKRAENINKL
jgi:hypothetical protein